MSLLVRLGGGGRWASLTAWLQQSAQLRGGADDGTGGVLENWLSSSLPTVVTASTVHRAASRGRCGRLGDWSPYCTTKAADVAIAADRAGDLGHGDVGRDDRCSGGVGCGQRRADVMVVLRGTWTVHDLIVALLALR